MRRARSTLTVRLIACMLLVSVAVGAEEPRSLTISGGVSNFNKSEQWFEAGVEFRTPIEVWKLAFTAGLFANTGPSGWVFAGLRRDFTITGPWVITPGFALTAYVEGDGKDLGGPLEFRSSLELGYRWPSRKRLAAAITHLSNAGIYDRNPGMNSLILTYSVPLR